VFRTNKEKQSHGGVGDEFGDGKVGEALDAFVASPSVGGGTVVDAVVVQVFNWLKSYQG